MQKHLLMILSAYFSFLLLGFFVSFIWYFLVGIQSVSFLSNMFVLAILLAQTK